MKQSVLALDVGEVRIGVAICQPEVKLALPKCVIRRQGRQADLEALVNLARQEQSTLWVVGLPRQADDSLSESARKIISFARRLLHASQLPVVFVDEWETTAQAQELLLSADVSRAKRRKLVDKLAATLILERYLEHGPLDISLE